MEKLFFGQNQCPSLFWIRVTSLNAMGRFFLPNFVLLSFGCFNSIGFVGYLFVTEMMNCFVEPFPRFLDWFDVAAYLIFVIFFTLAKFLENKIYTEKRQFFALNL